jgi:hypothetical protein
MNSQKFSVITPNYNQGSFLFKNLTSVDSQSYENVEHIVVDGSSTDDSLNVIKAFAPSKPFTWISEPDKGQSEAINKGFRIANGEILAWLNSDDYYSDGESIAKVADIFERRPDTDVVYGKGNYISQPSNEVNDAWIQSDPTRLIHSLCNTVGIIQPSVFFRKEALSRSGFLNESNHSCMDYEFWMQLVFSGASFYFLDKELACAVLHEDAKSVATRESQILDSLKVSQKYYNFAHPRWINAYALAKTSGATSFLKNQVEEDLAPDVKKEVAQVRKSLWQRYNYSSTAISQLLSGKYLDEAAATKELNENLPGWNELHSISRVNQKLPEGINCDLSLLPIFDSIEAFKDQVNRLSWYIPKSSGQTIRIYITHELEQSLKEQDIYSVVPEWNHLSVIATKASSLKEKNFISKSRTIGIWKDFKETQTTHPIPESTRVFNLDKHHDSRREAFNYGVLLHELSWSLRNYHLEAMPIKFREKIQSLPKFEKSYLFCTGPSVKDAINHDFSDGYRIVCNSLINNKELMDHIKPHFVVSADPVFHFGASQYATSFRRSLVEAISEYDLGFILPYFFYPNFISHFPELDAASIGIPQDPNADYLFNLNNNFCVKGAANILTILMIPLGATLSNNLYILGCDGRKPDDDYFWKHDKASQFSDLMIEARSFHPGFFDHCDYAGYYDDHCKNLDRMFRIGEELGLTFSSLTHSYIPCLVERTY